MSDNSFSQLCVLCFLGFFWSGNPYSKADKRLINRMVETLYFQETKENFDQYWVKMQKVVIEVLLHRRFVQYFRWYINIAKPETWAAYGADREFCRLISLPYAI